MSDMLFDPELLTAMRSIIGGMLPDSCVVQYQGAQTGDTRGGAPETAWSVRGVYNCRLEAMSTAFEPTIAAAKPEEKTRERLMVDYSAAGVIQKTDTIVYTRWDGIVKKTYNVVDVQEYTDNMEVPVIVELAL